MPVSMAAVDVLIKYLKHTGYWNTDAYVENAICIRDVSVIRPSVRHASSGKAMALPGFSVPERPSR